MTKTIAKKPDADILPATAPIELLDTCMSFKRDITLDEGAKNLHDLARMTKSCPWWVGDLLNYLEHQFGDKYTQAVDLTEWDYSTLKNFCWVCKGIPPQRRRKELSFYTHLEVMRLDEQSQDRLLKKTVENSWSIRELRTEVQALLPAHKQAGDRWLTFDKWWEGYESNLDVDVAIIAKEHAQAGWEAALAKGLSKVAE